MKTSNEIQDTLSFEEEILNSLYSRSKNGEIFTNLMEIILKPENILFAYKNIRSNQGSKTAGVDKTTIEEINELQTQELIDLIRNTLRGKGNKYNPKPVRQKLIPKENGKTRPLGIPTIIDRISQQCIKQVLEPIMEAKFSKHSYGFRPNRSVENCIADMNHKINIGKNQYVVEFDIKGFFDNVNHTVLLRQLWGLGIQDTELINKIKSILKAPVVLDNGKKIRTNKGLNLQFNETGTPQGGIISPLLANVYLNELDHYIESKWEEHKEINCCKIRVRKDGSLNKGNSYTSMRKRGIKEVYIVRYADDFRLLCKSRKDAIYFKEYITEWLNKRLKLEVSEEKTRLVNLKRQTGTFLGFDFKLQTKGKKKVLKTHIAKKKQKKIKENLLSQVKKMQHSNGNIAKEINKYNSMVMGIQNYYQIATEVSIDMSKIKFVIDRVIHNRLKDSIGKNKKEGVKLSPAIEKKYGKSEQMRYCKSTGQPILPIGYIQSKNPMQNKRGANKYTPDGRALLNLKEKEALPLTRELERAVDWNKPLFTINKLTLYQVQKGCCAITGIWFSNTKQIHCHHKTPKKIGGTDEYKNLMLITEDVHILIHSTCENTITKYLELIKPDKNTLEKINKYRKQAGNKPIEK